MLIFVFLLLSIVFAKFKRECTSVVFSFWILFFALITALRDGVGTDYEAYVYIFGLTPTLDELFSTLPVIDIGFWWFNSIIKTFTGSVVVMFFFSSFITTMLFFVVCKKILPSHVMVSLLIFYSFFLLRFEFNTIRHGMMVMWVWLGFCYVPLKDYRFFLFVIIGGLFHVVGFLFLPFYWLLNWRISNIGMFFIILLSYMIGFYLPIFQFLQFFVSANSVLGSKFQFYTEEYYALEASSSIGITLGMIIYLFLLLFFSIQMKKMRDNIYALLLRNSLFIALCMAFLLNKYGVFVERLSSLLYVSIAFIVPMIIQYLFRDASHKLLAYSILVLYCFLLLERNVLSVESSTGELQYVPYKMIKCFM
ncbi:EpsG family protein [uncultured Bacteroides sp.]|uniref:EpsG family protein n=1 Tax=uncultured Bacteroides sp. TaxID=162156 RepID=UPI0025A959E0|nr:EpsG family protein [uncultured Bacteroides sp.]